MCNVEYVCEYTGRSLNSLCPLFVHITSWCVCVHSESDLLEHVPYRLHSGRYCQISAKNCEAFFPILTIQGHRTRFETFHANNFSWLNDIVFRNQWFLGSWVVEIYGRSTIWYFFWSHTASAASNRNCQNSQVFWVKEG